MNSKQVSQMPERIGLDNYLTEPTQPLPVELTRQRPTGVWAFIVRQWILLLPLATAIVGSAILQNTFVDEHSELLPAVFFAAALLITAAMMHQRRMYQTNLNLVERLVINERLTHLHRLSLSLNQSLDAEQVVQAILDHARTSLSAEAAAFWLRGDFVPSNLLVQEQRNQPVPVIALPDELPDVDDNSDNESSLRSQWRQMSATGFTTEIQHRLLEKWGESVSRGECLDATRHHRIEYGVADDPIMSSLLGESGSAVSMLMLWDSEVVGVLLLAAWQKRLSADEVMLLDAINFTAAPALQNARLYDDAQRRADRDSVTGLYNHRSIQQQLNNALARSKRNGTSLGVVMMDLNNFKFFNDTYGHIVGDDVLRMVGSCLTEVFRASDVLGRFGGDEFIAVLPDNGAEDTARACRRIAANLGKLYYEASDGMKIPIGMSFGWAIFPQDAKNSLDLVSKADAMLYEHKHGGMAISEEDQDLVYVARAQARDEFRKTKEATGSGSFGVLDALVTSIDNKDRYTRRHSEEVAGLALRIAQEMGYSDEEISTVCISGLLHDVGKIAIPDSVLRHPGKLNAEENKVMQQHAVFGALIVKDVPHHETVLDGVRHHHEKWDGTGYPDGLAGEKIPQMGRLLAVPDAYSAMITDRPYRKGFTPEAALAQIEEGKGTQFDPTIADAFIRVMTRSLQQA